jgi:hypothetical protein
MRRLGGPAATVLVGALLALPAHAEPATYCDPSASIPPGYRLESHARKGLLIPGAVLFGVSYVFSMYVAVDKTPGMSIDYLGPNELPYDPSLLVVPVLGPWLALGTRRSYDCPPPGIGLYSGGCQSANHQRNVWTAVLITDGVVQLVGATFLTLGLSVRKELLVRTAETRAQLVPALIGSGQGLALVGTFGGP